MPEPATNELMYEILKHLQSGQSEMKADIREMKGALIGIREQLHTMEGNSLRQEREMATVRVKIERIENRLNLNDAPPH